MKPKKPIQVIQTKELVPDYKPAFIVAVIALAIVSIVGINATRAKPIKPQSEPASKIAIGSVSMRVGEHEYFLWNDTPVEHAVFCGECNKEAIRKQALKGTTD
jgi:hypothetical protein